MQRWLSQGQQTWKRNFARALNWSKELRVRHINLFFAMVFSLMGAVVIAIIAAWVLAPSLNVGTQTTSPADLTRLALTIAAGVGGVVALVVAYRRQRDIEQAKFVEAFGAAAKQLGDADVAVRLAGVYAMAGVADQTSKQKKQQCIDVLCGYLRLPYSPELGNNHQASLTLKKPANGSEGAEEEIRFQYRQNDKEVRQTIVRVIVAHLQKAVTPSWSSHDFDFTGAHLEEPSFFGAVFHGDRTSFRGATFSGERISFQGVTFSGGSISFQGATFSGGSISFQGATFTGPTSFQGAGFSGGNTLFKEAKFSGETTLFDGAEFRCEGTSFAGAEFNSTTTSFEDAEFSGGTTSFFESKFSGFVTNFQQARFSGTTTLFQDATFDGRIVWFRSVGFRNTGTSFKGATFNGSSNFSDAAFSSESTSFQGATFSGDTSFNKAVFGGGTTLFARAAFSGKISFSETTFSGTRVSFENPRVWSPPPLFDWDEGSEVKTPKPANVDPKVWPPTENVPFPRGMKILP